METAIDWEEVVENTEHELPADEPEADDPAADTEATPHELTPPADD